MTEPLVLVVMRHNRLMQDCEVIYAYTGHLYTYTFPPLFNRQVVTCLSNFHAAGS